MSTKNFNPTNPESLIYQNDIIKLTALGGIKLEGLDRMRVTLKVELLSYSNSNGAVTDTLEVPPIRHNLDLYNDNQLEKFIRKTAEKLETGTSIISSSIAEFIEQLENYRLEQVKNKEPDTPQPKTLSAQETEAATQFLKQANLLERTNEMIEKAGMIGEQNNRLLMYLIFTSRKLSHPLHIVSLGASGTGKTHLQEKVGELIPEEDKIEITTLSENAFYYFGQRELRNKLILIEDLDGAENVLYPLRELQSKKRISKTIAHKNTKGETKTIHLVVEGPVSVAGCTTREHIYEDNANRSFLIYLDESKEQDKRIMEYQRSASAGKINFESQEKSAELMRNCQRILEPIRVINPYAELLEIPTEVFKPRRTNSHYLQFIEVVTYYHQFQRVKQYDKQTGEEFIETTLEDIEQANKLLKQILLRKSDELTGACRNYFENLKLYLIGEGQKEFTNHKISRLFKIPLTTIKRYHLQLSMCGYLKTKKQKGSKAYIYQVVSYEEFKELQSRIDTVLDQALESLKASIEPTIKSKTNPLPKPKKPKSPKQPTTKSGLSKPNTTKP